MSVVIPIFLGLVLGFLVDYLADILPARKKWSRPVCSSCGEPRTWRDFFLLKPCRACGKPRQWRSVVTIFAGVILSLVLSLFPPLKWGYWFSLLIVTFFGLVIIIDIQHHLILHTVTLAGALIGLYIGSSVHGFLSSILGGVAGFLFMFIFYALGVWFARSRARKQGLDPTDAEALGFGDVTISGVLGLLLGFSNILLGLMTGILLAGLFSIILIIYLLARKKFESGNIYIPYGPFLVLGACVYIFFR